MLKSKSLYRLIYGNLHICNEQLVPIRTYQYRMEDNFVLHNFIFACAVQNVGTFIRKSVFDRVGLYDLSFPRGQDYEFFARAALQGCQFSYHNDFVAFYRERCVKYSYNSENLRVVNEIISNSALEKIFPMYEWDKNRGEATLYSLTTIALIFYRYGDFNGAIEMIEKAEKFGHNTISTVIKKLAYEAKGDVENAKLYPKADVYIQDLSLDQAVSIDRHELEQKLRLKGLN